MSNFSKSNMADCCHLENQKNLWQRGHKPGNPGILRDFSEHAKLVECVQP